MGAGRFRATNPASNHPPQADLFGFGSPHQANAGRRLSTLSAAHRAGSRRAAVSQPPESNAGTLREVVLAEFRIACAVELEAKVCRRRAGPTARFPTTRRVASHLERVRLPERVARVRAPAFHLLGVRHAPGSGAIIHRPIRT